MVIILYLRYIQNGAPKLLLMAQPFKHPQSESVLRWHLKIYWSTWCIKK